MALFLHTPTARSALSQHYARAFAKGVELFVVSAYLTEWDRSLILNPGCKVFRVIIGKDFGVTRKDACKVLMHWLPKERKSQFMVADSIDGFHPKAVFWKEKDGRCFTIIGSSNLTRAAFENNYEANLYRSISVREYADAKVWLKEIEDESVVVSEDWLKRYVEAERTTGRGGRRGSGEPPDTALISFQLPRPRGMSQRIDERRRQMIAFRKAHSKLISLFRRCAKGKGKAVSKWFYGELPKYWGGAKSNRLQGSGWERLGKQSDFSALSRSYIGIFDADDDVRDDVVVREIDALAKGNINTRKAFLSEMLCLSFPNQYPILNQPVKDYLSDIGFKAPRGSSEGARYLDLAKKLRLSLRQNPSHPAKDLAELDVVIWLKYRRKT